jgi:hypothetical protein
MRSLHSNHTARRTQLRDNFSVHRNFLLATVLLSIFFICALGMRNPWLHDNHQPKPRPRAIIEESTKKAPQEIIKSLSSVDLETTQAEVILPEFRGCRFYSQQLNVSPPVKARQLAARAPPVLFSPQI